MTARRFLGTLVILLCLSPASSPVATAQASPPEPESLTPEQRIYGLSLFWQEANYNFAFFDRVPELDWDSAYLAFIPRVLDAATTWDYYRELQRFAALLRDGHTGISMPAALQDQTRLRDTYPWVLTTHVEGRMLVTNAGRSLVDRLPPYSEIVRIDGRPAGEVALQRRGPATFAGTEHHRLERVFREALYGPADEAVFIEYVTPEGKDRSMRLNRDRRTREDTWTPDVAASPPFELRWVGAGDIAWVTLNTFNDTIVYEAFEAALPELRRRARGLILDVRANDGGVSPYGYRVASWITDDTLRAPEWETPEHRAALKAWGQWDARYAPYAAMDGWFTSTLDPIAPAEGERLRVPVVVLQDHGSFSAAEDFVVLVRDLPHVTTVGRHTGGATGQPLFFRLPGGGSARIATVRDRGVRAGRGYAPEVPVEVTVDDVRSGRDAALERAVEILTGR